MSVKITTANVAHPLKRSKANFLKTAANKPTPAIANTTEAKNRLNIPVVPISNNKYA